MTLPQEIFEYFDPVGIYAPIPDIVVTKKGLDENEIDAGKTLIHENTHRFQHLCSSVGLLHRLCWHTIYRGITDALLIATQVALPLKKSIAPLLGKLQRTNPEAVEATLSAFQYLASWPKLGVDQTTVKPDAPPLASVLDGCVGISIDTKRSSFRIQNSGNGMTGYIPITPEMIFESMAYFHGLSSRFAFYLGDNKYLSSIAGSDPSVEFHRSTIPKSTPVAIANKYFLDPMPPDVRIPHIYIISKICREAFREDTFTPIFGIVNTICVVSALLCCDYLGAKSELFLPRVYSKALAYMVTESLNGWAAEKIHRAAYDKQQMKAWLHSTIRNCTNSVHDLESAVKTQLCFSQKMCTTSEVLQTHMSKQEKILAAIIKDPTYLLDPHNLILNLFDISNTGYILGDKPIKSFDKGDRHMNAMNILFDVLWSFDNLACRMANSSATWESFPHSEAYQYAIANILTKRCTDFENCRAKIAKGVDGFCTNTSYKSQLKTLLDDFERICPGFQNKLNPRVAP